MAEKQIAWASGEGYITVIFGGDGNGSVFVVSDANPSFDAREQQITIRTLLGSPERVLSVLVKQEGKQMSTGTVIEFSYTGRVQEVTLPAGRYKLQCWGAQGGDVTGTYAVAGSNGGYSEGVFALDEPMTIYIFVGGKGTSYTSSNSQISTYVLNGGWNGGGAGLETTRDYSEDTDGRSFPRGGGGATDIALVNSSMSYSLGRTSRSEASLKSRIIVAGGGAGASAYYIAPALASGRSSRQQQGGGTRGKGQYPGKEKAAGEGGAFGLGANQSSADTRFCGGGGGGGWYGGGTGSADSTVSYIDYSGGGSGFVNIAANASYRPSGYTGIELESGSTAAGALQHPSPSGGKEVGHSGNGYAIITVL